jgi:hypothetical protein
MKANEENESEVVEDLVLFGDQFKRKCRNFGDTGHTAPQDYKNKTQQNGAYYTYCRRSGHPKRNYFKLKNKKSRNNSILSNYGNNGNHDRGNFDNDDVAFIKTTKPMKPANDTRICDS